MRVPRIFTDQPLVASATLTLDAGASHHIAKVLRMQAGRELVLFNGRGGEYAGVITEVGKRQVTVNLGEFSQPQTESPLRTELAIGISRGERMDWVVQKATELGVTRIQPVFSERTEVKLSGDRLAKRMQHWQQVIISACEQCQRNRLPELLQPEPLFKFLQAATGSAKYILHHRTDQQLQKAERPESVCLLVGPEGGFSDDEIASAQHNGFSALCLGPRVLRTETAPIAALAVLQCHWGDF